MCNTQTLDAQFIAVCSSAKPCEIGENLLSVSDTISRLQERLIHVGALVSPPALQRRTLSSLHSYSAMERSAAPMSVVSEPQRKVYQRCRGVRIDHMMGGNTTTCTMVRHYDHPSAALPQLSRHRYRPTWQDPSRQATLSLPREGLCGSYLPAGVCLCRSISRGEATDCRYGYE